MPASRQLPRSLIPLPGESLPGFLLRLSFRLGIAPAQLAELTGLAPAGRGPRLPAILLTGIPETASRTFTRMTRLTAGQAAQLSLDCRQGRYPLPATGPGGTGTGRRPLVSQPAFIPATRYCPGCLAGDGSAIQESLGGPWLKAWHLPVVFACPAHQQLLEHLCPECGQPVHGRRPGTYPAILPAMRTAGLHPAQCRTELIPARRYRSPVCCGARLDQSQGRRPADPRLIALQGEILDLLDPDGAGITISAGMPATPAGYFADLRALGLLACWTWPSVRHLSPSEDTAAAIDEHIASLRRHETSAGPAARTRLSRLPADAAASAGLAYIADRILGGSLDDVRELLRQFLPSSTRKASRTYWGLRVLRSETPCSEGLQTAYDPLLRTFTKEGRQPQGRRNAVLRPERWGPENIPAFLEQAWFEDHLACLECGSTVKAARRIAAATLVQWTAGGSIGDAARYLGFNPGGGQYAPTAGLARWLAALEPDRFTRALREIALRLDRASGLVNYQHRRQLLRDWALTAREWNDITSRLPPVPGPVQPTRDDRKRQEASAFIWARVTQGEPRFAPRPIEASQPDPVRRDWTVRRASTWAKIASPGRIVHYAELRNLLIGHSDQLARDIGSAEANDHDARRRLGEDTAVTENLPM
jgi:TniQ